jgi:hypothetical protein
MRASLTGRSLMQEEGVESVNDLIRTQSADRDPVFLELGRKPSPAPSMGLENVTEDISVLVDAGFAERKLGEKVTRQVNPPGLGCDHGKMESKTAEVFCGDCGVV